MASNQSQYTGQIQDGQMHGRGKLVYPNAEVYEVMLTLLAVECPPCAICFLLVNLRRRYCFTRVIGCSAKDTARVPTTT